MSEFEIGLWGVVALLVMVFLGVRVFHLRCPGGTAGDGGNYRLGRGGRTHWHHSPFEVGGLCSQRVANVHSNWLYCIPRGANPLVVRSRSCAWFGWVPGGLAVASVFATAGFAAVSGASTATAAVFSRVAIPHMLAAGYDRRLAAGVVAAGGTLASLIPPSAILVIYAIIVEESVGKLIIAGFLPGVVSALIYAALIIGQCTLKPELGRAIPSPPMAERWKTLPGTIPIFLVVAIIFWAMMSGKATPTEAGALGAFIILVVAIYHGMRWKALRDALLETAKLTVMIFALIWGILVFVRFLGYTGVPQEFAEWLTGLPLPPVVVMILILLGYAVLGMFMDAIGMLLLTLPVVYPAVIELGYSPIWFGIIVVKMCEVCLITPPVGLNCYVVAAVRPDIPLMDVFRGIAPFFCADVATVALFLAFPGIVTWLPDLMVVG